MEVPVRVKAREMIYSIIQLHGLARHDHTPGFYGIGKKTVAELVRNQLRSEIILYRVV